MTYDHGLIGALKKDAAPQWADYTHHPFVEELKSGALPRASFLHYLKQDYLFLIHFARAYALAVVKSTNINEIRYCAAIVSALINDEIKLHVASCASAGIRETELAATKEELTTTAYTRYVMDVGLSGDLLDLLVAFSPCVFGYGEIGTRLAKETNGPPTDHPYADWINTYAGQNFQDVCSNASLLLEAVARRLIGEDYRASPRWPQLVSTFSMACELESAFWSTGYAHRSED